MERECCSLDGKLREVGIIAIIGNSDMVKLWINLKTYCGRGERNGH